MVAAAFAGCYEHEALLEHKDNVLRLAEECRAKNKPTAVALVYDELARKAFDNKAHSDLSDFNQNREAKKLDRQVVKKAETMLEAQRKGNDKGGGKSKGKGYDGGKGKGRKGQGKHDDRGEKRKLPWNRDYYDRDDTVSKQWRR